MAPASVLKDTNTPKALLWAYQLRKEHNALLYRLDEVAKIAEDAGTAQAKSASSTGDLLTSVEEKVKQEVASVSNTLGDLTTTFSTNETELAQYKQCLREERDALEESIRALESKIDELSERTTGLEKKVDGGLSFIKEQNTPGVASRKRKSPAVEDYSYSASSLISLDLEKSPTLPKQPGRVPPSSPLPPSIWPESRFNLPSRASLPTQSRQGFQTTSIRLLTQNSGESLARYMERGQELIRKLPRRKEGQVTDLFVAGLQGQDLQERFEVALDREGWTWDNLTAFYEMNLKQDQPRTTKRKRRSAKRSSNTDTSYKIPDVYPSWWHNAQKLS
ncbi:MAG: hypothetical protein Q9160_001710 [Pyrenula sp. 1 TL-2023]